MNGFDDFACEISCEEVYENDFLTALNDFLFNGEESEIEGAGFSD